MRDLNSLYFEYLITNIHRERREQSRVAEATAGQLPAWRRLIRAMRRTYPARIEPACKPTELASPEQVTAS